MGLPAPAFGPLATALAVVGLSVAVALARAQLERRADKARGESDEKNGRPPRRRDRRPSLFPGEPLAEGVKRVILGQLDLAIELLERYPAENGHPATSAPALGEEETVHETRKALKRLRALLRLVREELQVGGELATLRGCARALAGSRDAEVMVATLDALVQRHPKRLAASPAVGRLRAQLLAEREAAAEHAIRDPRVRADVVAELRAVRARLERWVPEERGFQLLLAPRLRRLYRRGRRGLRAARRGADAERLHAWRKLVKDLRYAAETLDHGRAGGRTLLPDGRHNAIQADWRAEKARGVARRADRLGELLGDEHDLALLAHGVRKRAELLAGERGTRKRLLKLIARRRAKLRRRALHEGERLYRLRPRRFVRRLSL